MRAIICHKANFASWLFPNAEVMPNFLAVSKIVQQAPKDSPSFNFIDFEKDPIFIKSCLCFKASSIAVISSFEHLLKFAIVFFLVFKRLRLKLC